MATVAHDSHLPAVDEHGRAEAAGDLQATLVELIDLSLLGKQLHWNIVGRPFKPLHEHLDELVDSWRELSDTVAERAIALGVPPDGQATAVTAGSGLAPVAGGARDTDRALSELVPRLADVAQRIRARMERLGELDLASQDVLIEVVREFEKQLWMLRAPRCRRVRDGRPSRAPSAPTDAQVDPQPADVLLVRSRPPEVRTRRSS